jgi:hypothetical protein
MKMKKLFMFSMALVVIFMVLSACNNTNNSDPSDESPYFLLSDGSRIALDVQYIRTSWFPDIDYPIITVVSSKIDLEQYYEKNWSMPPRHIQLVDI